MAEEAQDGKEAHEEGSLAVIGILRPTPLLLLLTATVFAAGQEVGFEPPGEKWMQWEGSYSWSPAYLQRCGIDRPLLAEWSRTLHRLASLWAQTPGATGAEYYSQMRGTLDSCKGRMRGTVSYWPWALQDVVFKPIPGQPGRQRADHTGETTPLTIYINRLQGLTVITQMNAPDGNDIGYVKFTRRFAGYAVYNFDHVLLVPAPGREPFIPVTLDEALRAWLEHSPTWDEWGRSHAQSLLGKLDSHALQKPAYYHRNENNREEIVADRSSGSWPIVRYNPDYFDNTKPRSVPQVLAVDVHFLDLVPPIDDPRMRGRLARRMLEATDWRQLAAELMH